MIPYRSIALTVSLLFVFKTSTAQYYFYDNDYYENTTLFEAGASISVMNCLTDLGGKKGIGKKYMKDLNLGNTQMAGSIYAVAIYKNAVALRFELSFGQIKANDSILKPVRSTIAGRYERNLSFRSSIIEVSAIMEFHPLFIFKRYDEDKVAPRYSPYLLAGVGFFSFNPQAKLGNTWVDLQPLSTEGQGFAEYPDRKPYKLHQFNIPLGAGVKYELSARTNLRAEFVYRILNTDYLDDVSSNYINPSVYSNYFRGYKLTNALLLNDRQYELDPTHITSPGDQRGNSKNNDAYFTFNLKLGIILGRDRRHP